jgi:hypothetical protein
MTGGEPATPAVEPAAVDHGVAHDAGYDSYMTGVVFLRVAGRLLAATAAQAAAAEAHFAAEGAAGDAGAESVHRLDRNRAALAAITATPLPSTTLHDVLRMVMSAPAPGAAAEVGVQTGPPMQALLVSSARAVGNVLNNMQAFDRIAACIKLDELRALDRAGRAKDTAPAAGELGAPGQPDAGEGALLVARARARDKACWLHICGLDYSVKDRDLLASVADACGVRVDILDPKKVYWVDDSSAFVKVPSAFHALDAVAAATGGKRPTRLAIAVPPPADAAASPAPSPTSAKRGLLATVTGILSSFLPSGLGGSGGGDNMLGIAGLPHEESFSGRAAEEAVPAAKRARMDEGVFSSPRNLVFYVPAVAPVDFSGLAAADITPFLALAQPRTRPLSAYTVRTYAQWLELPHVVEVFGNELDWECVEGVSPAAAAAAGEAPAVSPYVPTAADKDKQRTGPGSAPGCVVS